MRSLSLLSSVTGLVASLLGGCGGDDVVTDGNTAELITTVIVTFDDNLSGPVIAEFDDPDGDGGDPPTVDAISLVSGRIYDVTVAFQNRLESPPEEITDEVRDESADHQIFLTGTAIDGPASDQPGAPLVHMYNDTDANDLPIGLQNIISTATGNEGTGQLTVTLRHLPELNGNPQKTAELAATVRASGIGAILGDTDATATFTVTTTAP